MTVISRPIIANTWCQDAGTDTAANLAAETTLKRSWDPGAKKLWKIWPIEVDDLPMKQMVTFNG